MAVNAAKQVVTSRRRPAAPAGDPILAANITAPDLPDWVVPRSRITKLIAQGTRWCPLTVVTGPVGAGKTMALALWTAAEPGPVAWVRLDECNTRPAAFWSHVGAALRQSGVAVSGVPPGAARGRAAENLFLLLLASVLAAQDPPVTLVLDGLHLIAEPKVLNGLDFLVRSVGSGLRLVASSRADPLLPLHRYRLTGQLAEIRGSDLAFSADEADLLLAQHGCTLSADSRVCLVRLTEGWAAGLRLAAISMAGHPEPDRFVRELHAEGSALTGYLVEEVLNAQPPEVRELLLSTSILDHVNAEAAGELAGNRQAGRILAALAHANAFVQPIGGGWYRYHTLFAQMLRLTLKLEHPDRIASLHRQAARWHERNGQLTGAVRHATEAGAWQLAASMVIDGLAIGEIIEPRGAPSLAGKFARMPRGEAWPQPQPYLVCAAADLSAGRPGPAAAALDAAEKILDRLPAGQEDAARLAAAMIRLAASRRSGDLDTATRAVACAEALTGRVSGRTLAQCAGIRAQVLLARGAVELWSGRLGEAARVLDSGVAAAVAAAAEQTRIDCLSHLALAEALRGRLGRAAKLAGQATAACPADGHGPQGQHLKPAALAALAWVHLELHELGAARGRLEQLDTALRASPDALIGAVACLTAAYSALAEGRAEVATQFVARARSAWPVPSWLEQRLSLAESRALATGRDIEAAPAARRAPVVEPLTEREQEVLRHVSVMLTTAEIASELYISTNTVKSHIKNICHKLAATHRGEAVRRARQLRLI